MSERYKRLFSLDANLYAEGMPIIFEAGVLLKDTKSNSTMVQLKILNISLKVISALKVQITGFDSFGSEVSRVEFQYADLYAERGIEFGVQTPIFLDNNSVHSFDVKALGVVFIDKDIWNANYEKMVAINTVKLSEYFKDKIALMQYSFIYGKDADYIYSEHFDLWHCICGKYNHIDENVCFGCNRKRSDLNNNILDESELHKQGKQRLNDLDYQKALRLFESDGESLDVIINNLDKARIIFKSLYDFKDSKDYVVKCDSKKSDLQNQIQKNIQDKRDKIRRRKRRMIFSFVTVGVSILTFVVLYNVLIYPELKYQSAKGLFQDNSFSSALLEFNNLGNYKDSEEYYAYIDCIVKLHNKKTDKETLNSIIVKLDNIDIDGSQIYKDKALEAYFNLIKKEFEDEKYSDLLTSITFLSSHGYDSKKCTDLENEYKDMYKDLPGEYADNYGYSLRSFSVRVDYLSGEITISCSYDGEYDGIYTFDLNSKKSFYNVNDYIKFNFIGKNILEYSKSSNAGTNWYTYWYKKQ